MTDLNDKALDELCEELRDTNVYAPRSHSERVALCELLNEAATTIAALRADNAKLKRDAYPAAAACEEHARNLLKAADALAEALEAENAKLLGMIRELEGLYSRDGIAQPYARMIENIFDAALYEHGKEQAADIIAALRAERDELDSALREAQEARDTAGYLGTCGDCIRDAYDTVGDLQAENAKLRELLRQVREACLFYDDDGPIGVTEDAVIHSDLFNEICAALTEKEGEVADIDASIASKSMWDTNQ